MIIYKSRTVDYGNGTQYVELINKTVSRQWISSNGNHWYTGDGNPEIVGKAESSLRGMGFRKVEGDTEYNALLNWSISKDFDESLHG